jgi:hypothetical protein
MYIVAVAWLYVTILMALTERSVIAGILTFLLYGLVPLMLFWWIVGARRRRARGAVNAPGASMDVQQLPHQPDEQRARGDQ